jgi:hypothetical protein
MYSINLSLSLSINPVPFVPCVQRFSQIRRRWLNTLKEMEHSRFRSVFFDNYFLLKNKKYLTDVKQTPKGFEFFYKSYATITFQDGRNVAIKVI